MRRLVVLGVVVVLALTAMAGAAYALTTAHTGMMSTADGLVAAQGYQQYNVSGTHIVTMEFDYWGWRRDIHIWPYSAGTGTITLKSGSTTKWGPTTKTVTYDVYPNHPLHIFVQSLNGGSGITTTKGSTHSYWNWKAKYGADNQMKNLSAGQINL
jgi:hypothetical protein